MLMCIVWFEIMSDSQRGEFEEKLEVDFSFELPNVGRFRVNAFNQSWLLCCISLYSSRDSDPWTARGSWNALKEYLITKKV